MLGDSKQEILNCIKRHGLLSIDTAAKQTGLSKTTLREHFAHLERDGLVERQFHRSGPGRPALRYSLTEKGLDYFPSLENEMIGQLVRFIKQKGQDELLEEFFETYWEQRLKEAKRRLKHLEEDDMAGRLKALHQMLEEHGFMPEIKTEGDSLNINECNCPFRETVKHTRLPCQLEARFYEKLFERDLERVTYIPDGHHTCTYEMNWNKEKEKEQKE